MQREEDSVVRAVQGALRRGRASRPALPAAPPFTVNHHSSFGGMTMLDLLFRWLEPRTRPEWYKRVLE